MKNTAPTLEEGLPSVAMSDDNDNPVKTGVFNACDPFVSLTVGERLGFSLF